MTVSRSMVVVLLAVRVGLGVVVTVLLRHGYFTALDALGRERLQQLRQVFRALLEGAFGGDDGERSVLLDGYFPFQRGTSLHLEVEDEDGVVGVLLDAPGVVAGGAERLQ